MFLDPTSRERRRLVGERRLQTTALPGAYGDHPAWGGAEGFSPGHWTPSFGGLRQFPLRTVVDIPDVPSYLRPRGGSAGLDHDESVPQVMSVTSAFGDPTRATSTSDPRHGRRRHRGPGRGPRAPPQRRAAPLEKLSAGGSLVGAVGPAMARVPQAAPSSVSSLGADHASPFLHFPPRRDDLHSDTLLARACRCCPAADEEKSSRVCA